MKKWYTSKTEIGAIVAAIALSVQTVMGTVWLDPEAQMAIVIIYCAVIRFFTDKGITL